MSGKLLVEILESHLLPEAAYEFVSDPAHGAFDCFIGMVRESNLGKKVQGVSYDVFIPLAKNTIQEICKKVTDTYEGKINIYVAHYKGRLDVGGISVIIAVSTPHRAESFAACRQIIEDLKHSAPIWKQEHYTDGDSQWVQGHALCQHE